MDINNLKQAEDFLVESTENDNILTLIEEEINTKWDISELVATHLNKIKELLSELSKRIFADNENDTTTNALHWIVFDRIYERIQPIIKTKFFDDDSNFFEKCKLLSDIKVSAEQFGADEKYSIPLRAAVVELSTLDTYKTPTEKMHCLYCTFDLVFAEIKTAMVSIISQKSDNEIPIIDNRDIIPVLMTVIVNSKQVHMFSNLFYLKSFYYNMEEKRIVWEIFKTFQTAINKLMKLDVKNIQPVTGGILKSIDLEQYIRITSVEEENTNSTLVDQENERVLNLITQATSDDN